MLSNFAKDKANNHAVLWLKQLSRPETFISVTFGNIFKII